MTWSQNLEFSYHFGNGLFCLLKLAIFLFSKPVQGVRTHESINNRATVYKH